MKTIVRTNKYEITSGKKPRGFGMWAFQIGSETFWVTGNYAEAKKRAVEKAKSEGIEIIYVLG